MQDPLVVAFTIRRPWPTRRGVSGTRYWPAIVTVWHREPGGHDAGTVCRHYQHRTSPHGKEVQHLHAWKFHVHHWKVQVHALLELRRRLLTRCAWCGGRSRRGDPVNVSHHWDGPRGRWWRGEQGLSHGDCSSVQSAHSECLCDQPGELDHGDYGRCSGCGKFRAWQNPAEMLPPRMSRIMLASLPGGSRIPASMRPEMERLWAEERAERSPRR